MSGPKLLLLDEPFIGVAPIVVDEVIAALQRIASEGVTILLVEQNVHRALEFVQRAYVIENGRSVLEGTSAQLLQDSEFSSKFLGLD
jgi:branched-chain amino acid transport system ATP-binding protein